jgi:hypothetical protein
MQSVISNAYETGKRPLSSFRRKPESRPNLPKKQNLARQIRRINLYGLGELKPFMKPSVLFENNRSVAVEKYSFFED